MPKINPNNYHNTNNIPNNNQNNFPNNFSNNFPNNNDQNNNPNNFQSHFVFAYSNISLPNQNPQVFSNMNFPNFFPMQNQSQQNFNEMFNIFKENMQNMRNVQNMQNVQILQNMRRYKEPSFSEHFSEHFVLNNNNNNNNYKPEEEKLSEVTGEVSNDLYDPKRIYKAIIDLRDKYPQGLSWTNANNHYSWGEEIVSNLGYSSYNGSGCFAFAMIASDAAFGKIPVYKFFDKNKIRVGDILRINNDTHFVIVLKIIDKSKFKIAEGNYNASINWGRVIDINETGFNYGYTRYKN